MPIFSIPIYIPFSNDRGKFTLKTHAHAVAGHATATIALAAIIFTLHLPRS